jgi:dihydrofolate reductase
MRSIIVTEFVSVDGVFEAPGPDGSGYAHAGWTFEYQDAERMKFKLDETLGAEAILLGRRTYEGFAAAWPGRTDEVGFAAKMNSMPKYVVSTTLRDPTWANTTVVSDRIPERLAELRAGDGGEIVVHGSGTLVNSLLDWDLVDELRLMTFPVVLGSGRRLFTESRRVALTLAEVDRYDSGVVTLTYRR